MKVILRTYDERTGGHEDQIVEVGDSYDFVAGPYDPDNDIPFAVGSNQTIVSLDD